MNYEEKYKKALEKARAINNGEDVDIKAGTTVCEYIFPELKENEDERIRKEIIKTVELYGPKTGDPKVYHDMISWLEKQGEQKSLDDVAKEVTKNKETATSFLKSCGIMNADGELADEYKIEQSKQKPAEWSKEDINMIDWLIRCCEEEHKELCNDKYGHQDIVSDLKHDCRKKWDWLESLKNRVAPQNTWKPSDEQMEEIKAVAKYCDTVVSSDAYKQGVLEPLYSELKKLKEK